MTAKVDFDKCEGWGKCVSVCPSQAIEMINGRPAVDKDVCCDCAQCEDACPTKAIKTD